MDCCNDPEEGSILMKLLKHGWTGKGENEGSALIKPGSGLIENSLVTIGGGGGGA